MRIYSSGRVFTKGKSTAKDYAEKAKSYRIRANQLKLIIGNKIVWEVRHELERRKIGKTGKLAKNIRFIKTSHGIRIISGTKYHKYVNQGVKTHKMVYLLKSKKAVPIKDKKTGKTIFRKPTLKSMMKGKWVHPGYNKGKGFFKEGIKIGRRGSIGFLDELAKITLKG